MVKMLFKTLILLFIIFSIYFIVNPSACSNFLAGRVTNVTDEQPTQDVPSDYHGGMMAPVGDGSLAKEKQTPAARTFQTPGVQTFQTPASQTSSKLVTQPTAAPTQSGKVSGVVDTNTLTEPFFPQYSQEDVDYAVASRYVELENEYARKKKVGKDTAKEISYIVMDDFELTQQEWESFLERATASNLFDKVRKEMATAE